MRPESLPRPLSADGARTVPARRALAVACVVVWGLLAVDPASRSTWVLENLLLVPAALAFVVSHRWIAWSGAAVAAVTAFLALHTLGAHFTYSLVPWDHWWSTLTGLDAPRLARNPYDRLVHFAYGALLAVPAFEYGAPRFGRAFTAWQILLVVMATSMLYELIEWGAAVIFGGEAGQAFLGMQGDVWDAQADMALATLGALASVCALLVASSLPRAMPARAGSGPGGGIRRRAGHSWAVQHTVVGVWSWSVGARRGRGKAGCMGPSGDVQDRTVNRGAVARTAAPAGNTGCQ